MEGFEWNWFEDVHDEFRGRKRDEEICLNFHFVSYELMKIEFELNDWLHNRKVGFMVVLWRVEREEKA
jgi:hypothetical protein